MQGIRGTASAVFDRLPSRQLPLVAKACGGENCARIRITDDKQVDREPDLLRRPDGIAHSDRWPREGFLNIQFPNWEVEVLRLTAFPAVPLDYRQSGWWENVVGEPPETESTQPRTSLHEEVGPLGESGAGLNLRIQPERIDWLVTKHLPGAAGAPLIESASLPTFGSFESALQSIRDIAIKWFPEAPSIQRLALGAVLLLPAANRQEGYEILGRLLPALEVDPENSTDLSYSINRPRLSKAVGPSLRINRLSRWSVVQLVGFRLQVPTNAGDISKPLTQDSELTAARLELDINTSADHRESFLPGLLVPILDELTEMAIEVAGKGDVP
jgi:hypothetical protein